MSKIKVLCVDDSALIRKLLTEIVNKQPDMEMVATAPDPLIARDFIKQYKPDVITLDVEMPKMDGLDFLERLMRLHPLPVIMISSLTSKGSEITLTALELGAIDFVAKPHMQLKEVMTQYGSLIADKIRIASKARPVQRNGRKILAKIISAPLIGSEKIIAVGSSTGGTDALNRLLAPLPRNCPGLVIAQHMPPGFTGSFAKRLDKSCQISVKEAEDGDRILPGHAYIAPGALHMELSRSGANYVVKLNENPPVNRHRPSVDVLFNSVAKAAGKNAVGVILTGMGNDGAQGLLEMRKAGAYTLAQSEASCVIFGMPREAIALNAVKEIADLDDMPQRMLDCIKVQSRRI
jgi:two-component system chemotaxis response regulator CheB